MSSAAHTPSAYRADIDGLRAVSILLVVAYHAFPQLVPGGYVGVDVFFVISGFLISGIIFNDLAQNRFSFLLFYARRFRRLLPSLILMITAVAAAGAALLPADDFNVLGKHILAGATFTSNFTLLKESGYFGYGAEVKPLLHLWSLAIEEQFYLLWPLLLFSWPTRLSYRYLLVGTLATSLFLNLVNIGKFPDATFFMLHTRLWELALGGWLVFEATRLKINSWWRTPISLTAFGALLASAFIFSEHAQYPGWRALVPTLSAAALIAAGNGSWLNRKILSSKIFVWFGLISYPLYLWHWPLLVFGRKLLPENLALMSICAILISIVLAHLTRTWVEMPLQDRSFDSKTKQIKTRLVYLSAFSALIALAVFGWLLKFDKLIQPELRSRIENFRKVYEDQRELLKGQIREDTCYLVEARKRFDGFGPDCVSHSPKRILLIGDSYSAQLYPGLKRYFEGAGVNIDQLNAGTCPLIGFEDPRAPHCVEVGDTILNEIRSAPPPTVVIAANWRNYTENEGTFRSLRSTVEKLREAGVQHIIVVNQTPLWEPFLPKIIERKFIRENLPVPTETSIGLLPETFDIDRRLKKELVNSEAQLLSPVDSWCDRVTNRCKIRLKENDPVLTSFDGGHFTVAASIAFANELMGPAVEKAWAGSKR